MIKNKIYKLLVSGVLLVSSTMLWAAPSLTVENTLHNAAVDLVQVPITITNDSNVASLQFELVYPSGVVQAVAAFPGAVLSNNTHLVDSQLVSTTGGNDTFRIIVAAQTATAADRNINNGELLKVPFMVNASQFNQNVLVNIQNVVATNATGDSATIPVNLFAGLIVTLNDTTTDSDGDGIADSFEIGFGTDPSASGGVLIPSGTTLSGPITQNSVLEPGGSYVVSANLDIAAGTRLTAYNNTTLAFNYNTGLTVNGELSLLGDGNVFTSSYASPWKGSWRGITINASATGVVFNNALIEWAQYGLYFDNVGGQVHNTTLQNNTYGIYVNGTADPVITNGNAIVSNSYGIYIYSTRQPGDIPNPILNYNSIHSNTYFDLYSYGVYDAPNVTLNAENNWWGTTDVASIVAKIYDNMDYAYYSPKVDFVDFLDSENGTPINGNVIGGDYTGTPLFVSGDIYHALETVTVPIGQTMNVPDGTTFMFYGGSTTLMVDGTLNVAGTTAAPVTFRSNNNSAGWSAWQGIEISASASNVLIDNALIKDAVKGIYFNNSNGDVNNTRIENNYYGIYIYQNASPLITNSNTIIDNGYGIYAYGSNTPSMTPGPVVTYNSIYNNAYYDYYAYLFYDASNVTLDATYNWWGTTDTTVIDGNVYDNADYYYYAPVLNYTPYLDSEGGNPIGLPDQPTSVISGPTSGFIGDVLSFDGSGSSDPQGDPLTYSWDMGDGTQYSTVTVNHSYTVSGTFTITLLVSDGQFSHSTTIGVDITDPNAVIITSPSGFVVENVTSPGQPIMGGDRILVLWGDINSPDPGSFSTRIGIFPVGGNQYSYIIVRTSSSMTFDANRGKWSYFFDLSSSSQPGDYEIRFTGDYYILVGNPSEPFTIGTP